MSFMTSPADNKPETMRFPFTRLLQYAARLVAACLAALFIGFLVFTGSIRHEPEGNLPRADGIVVLTGGEARISQALELLSKNYGKRLLISGVNPATSRFQLIRLNPENANLFRCCIDLDRYALDTTGNAEQSAEWVRRRGFKSLIVVTSSYHMPRSLLELRRKLPDTRLIAYPVTPPKFETERWWTHPASLRMLVSEYLKIVPALARFGLSRIAAAGSPAAERSGGSSV